MTTIHTALDTIAAYVLTHDDARSIIFAHQLADWRETPESLREWAATHGLAVGHEGGRWIVSKEKSV